MKKLVFFVLFVGLIISGVFAQDALLSYDVNLPSVYDSEIFVDEAVRATIYYFRRYTPRVVSNDGDNAIVQVQYGRHPVTVTITTGNRNNIAIESSARSSQIIKWLSNLDKNIRHSIAKHYL
ncbi:MAG: hypothetical protein FWD26_10085 [Treponema sp.]|nr:hypothetical protein [Treponema sp.]